jgi:ABC-type lipoprotein export system ATPase subunit
MEAAPLMESRDLRRDFPAGEGTLRVLRGVTLRVERGSFTAVMGASGAGKSTLLYILGLLLRPSGGTLLFDGHSLAGWSDRRLSDLRGRRIGIVFQDYNLIPGLTLEENVESGLAYTGLPRSGWPRRVRRAVGEVGLEGRERSFPAQLSGGEAQRAAVARVMVKEPDLVLADEPTGSLDGEAEGRVLDLLRRLAESNRAVLLVTHDERVAARADRLWRLEEGRLRVED